MSWTDTNNTTNISSPGQIVLPQLQDRLPPPTSSLHQALPQLCAWLPFPIQAQSLPLPPLPLSLPLPLQAIPQLQADRLLLSPQLPLTISLSLTLQWLFPKLPQESTQPEILPPFPLLRPLSLQLLLKVLPKVLP